MCIRTFLNASKISTEQVFVYTFHPKKNWIKKIIFSRRKIILKILIFDFFFESQKKISKIKKSIFKNKIEKIDVSKKNMFFRFFIFFSKCWFFFENRNFQNYFSPRKIIIFCSNFFLMKGLYKNLIRTDFWSGSRILSVSDPLLNIQLARFIQTSLHN